ncbi:Epoxide hydrolase [Operophtera brumata]|uniref:Epoxide hydrolase n=1 Tax=Operophtera brumata TaxID=104452 RepID=A0A0L7KXV8_OPEBR|nr:Epoxide hydrolase [Operophtera brumata]
MHRLGHKKFYVQGGDWGAAVGSAMATLFPEDVLGYHTNMPVTHVSKASKAKIVQDLLKARV